MCSVSVKNEGRGAYFLTAAGRCPLSVLGSHTEPLWLSVGFITVSGEFLLFHELVSLKRRFSVVHMGNQWVRFLSIETWHTFTQVPLLKWEISRKKITIPKYLLINRFNFNPLGSRNWYFSVGDTGPRLELPIYSFIYLSIGCFVWIFRCSLRASFCTLTHVCIFLVVILKNHIQAPTRSCI